MTHKTPQQLLKEIELLKAENTELKNSKDSYQLIAENSQEYIWQLNLEADIIYINNYAYNSTVSEKVDWKKIKIDQLIHPNDLDYVLKVHELVILGNTMDYDVRILNKYGTYNDLDVKTIPIFDDDKVIGTLSFGNNVTSQKIAEESLLQRENYLSALNESKKSLLNSSIATGFQQFVDILGPASSASRTYIFLNHTDNNGKIFMSQKAEYCSVGIKPEIDNPKLQNLEYDDLFKRWIKTLPKGDLIQGKVKDFPIGEKEFLVKQDIKAVLIIPIIIEKEFVGFIGFDNCTSEVEWNKAEQNFLRSAANDLAQFIERSKIQEITKQNYKRQKLISTISSSFVGVFDLDDSINNLLKEIGEYSDADRSYVFLFREDGKIMDNTHEWCADGITPEIDTLQNQPCDIFPWWMSRLHDNQLVNIEDVSKLPTEAITEKEILESQGIKSVIVIPLNFFGQLIGFMGLDNNRKAKAWPIETIKVLKISSEILSNTLHSKKVEEELQMSEKKYRSLTESMEDVVVRISPSGKILYVSPAAERFGGYIPAEEIGNHVSKYLYYKTDLVRGLKSLADVLINHKSGSLEYVFKPKNKPPFPVEHTFTPLIKNGKVDAVQLVIRNISNRKRIENALRDSEERLKILFESAPDAYYISDTKGVFLDGNKAVEDLIGYKREELIGKDFFKLNILTKKHLPKASKKLLNIIIGNSSAEPEEFEFTHKNGSKVSVEIRNYPVKIKNKTVILGIAHDITERKKTEKALRESKQELQSLNLQLIDKVKKEVAESRKKDRMMIVQSKQAAMGEMIGNIAHQWRQPLNDIGLYIQNLQDKYDYNVLNKDTLDEIVDRTMDKLDYMSHTIDDFRNFFRSDKEKIVFSLSDNIKRTINLTEANFKNNLIDVILDLQDDVHINGYSNEFAQAVLNILNNAKDELVSKNIKNPFVKISLTKSKNKITIKISNNGGEIPTEIIDNIFDPYFTTKPIQTGTGLGLYISKTIIERNMNGKLYAHNHNNLAEFIIEFS